MVVKFNRRPCYQMHSDLLNRDYVAWRRFLNDSELWSREMVARYQLIQVKRIVAHAYKNTSGYRELYENAGVHPRDIQTLNDVLMLPLIEKEMIREKLEDFSVAIKGRTYITTGGSTGIPFGFYRDPRSFARELASKAHQYARIGWAEGDRQIVFRGLPVETADHMVFEPGFNELRCSSYHLTPEWMENYRQKAWEYQPEWVRCYPSSGYLYACFLRETGRPFPKVKGILCASENLYDFQERLLAEAFGGRVFAHYGHYELAVLAGFCEKEDTYHVLPQYGYAELIDAEGRLVTEPGKLGEIVATSFIMHATPFIRYRTSDLAVLKSWGCGGCGRPYQIWERIEGRLQEFIITRTGRHISMTAVNFHDDIFDDVKQFQFYQEEVGQVVFRYIPKPTFNQSVLQDIHRRLLLKMGNDVDLHFEAVDNIPLTHRGKHRFLIQKIKLKLHDI